jgi:hypothetical protein
VLRIQYFLLISALLGIVAPLQAQSLKNEQNHPIETQADLGFLDIIGGDMKYSLDERPITSYQQFKSLIYPLGDLEASHLIRNAESTDMAAWIVLSAGLATSLDIALVYNPPALFSSDISNRAVEFLATAQISLGLFAIIHNVAEGKKFNAVQRYNRVLRKHVEESSVRFEPKLYSCSNGPVLGGQLSF